MLRSSWLVVLVVLILGVGPGCQESRPRTDEGAGRATEPTDFGPTAAYERRFFFLGPGQRLPTAAMLDFVALSDSLGLRQGVRARLADGTDWMRLLDAGWQMDRMREPWRLVPHGPLALIVGDGGELNALVIRGDMEVRIEPGPTVAEFSPDRGTQLVLRQGRLALGAELVHGVLLDAQLGRALDPSVSRDAGHEESAVDDDGDATPAARPGAEGLLLGANGFHLVFATAAAGRIAWIHEDGRDDVRRGAQLQAVGWERVDEAVQVPNAWRIVGGGLDGQLTAEVVDGAGLAAMTDAEGIGYAIVTGWVEDRGDRREVYGLVRHVR
jgi:hypothetical protein